MFSAVLLVQLPHLLLHILLLLKIKQLVLTAHSQHPQFLGVLLTELSCQLKHFLFVGSFNKASAVPGLLLLFTYQLALSFVVSLDGFHLMF